MAENSLTNVIDLLLMTCASCCTLVTKFQLVRKGTSHKMEPAADQHNVNDEDEDEDSTCRLRHQLNIHCLSHIFRYLPNSDLYTVAGMNDYYKQIINEAIIPKRLFNFWGRLPEIQQIFKRHGKHIKQFNFDGGETKFRKLNQLIAGHCSIDQLKTVFIHISQRSTKDQVNIELTEHFRRVDSLWFSGSPADERLHVIVSLSDTLRHLHFEEIKLHPTFDWRELVNLTGMNLIRVKGFDEHNFIEFLRRRPKLENFYQNGTIRNGMHNIGVAMVKYCSKQIQSFRDLTDHERSNPDKFYSFLAGFDNLKEVWLSTRRICASDLIHPIKRLTEKNTVEKLMISVRPLAGHGFNCICEGRKMYLKQLKLKSLHIDINIHDRRIQEHRMKILAIYSRQILAKVEDLRISGSAGKPYDVEFLKLPKLRQLSINDCLERIRSNEVLKLVSTLRNILKRRNNGQSDGHSSDIIKLNVRSIQLGKFRKVSDVDRFIEFRICDDFEEFNHDD